MEYHIELLMQTTILKSLEVSPPFFSLSQSIHQNKNISGGNDWFCQSEGDPWQISNEENHPHMIDPWASAIGNDIWEMGDHADPFSVCNSPSTSLQCHPILENDTPLISSTYGPTAVSTELLSAEFPEGLSSGYADDSIAVQTAKCIQVVTMMKILTGKMSRRTVALRGFNLLIQ